MISQIPCLPTDFPHCLFLLPKQAKTYSELFVFTESLNLKLIRSVKVCIRMCSKNHEWWYKRHFGGLVSFVAILWELFWDSEKCFALDLGFLMFISSFGDDLEFILHTFNKGSQHFIPHPPTVCKILAKDYYTLRKVEKSSPVLDCPLQWLQATAGSQETHTTSCVKILS